MPNQLLLLESPEARAISQEVRGEAAQATSHTASPQKVFLQREG